VAKIVHNDALNAAIGELAEMFNVKIAVIMSIPFITLHFISFNNNTSNQVDGNNVYVNWIICVLITFFMDQFVGVVGFMGLESHGMHVDADFSLGNENPFNPVRKFRYGD
jgi:hypothetical protein